MKKIITLIAMLGFTSGAYAAEGAIKALSLQAPEAAKLDVPAVSPAEAAALAEAKLGTMETLIAPMVASGLPNPSYALDKRIQDKLMTLFAAGTALSLNELTNGRAAAKYELQATNKQLILVKTKNGTFKVSVFVVYDGGYVDGIASDISGEASSVKVKNNTITLKTMADSGKTYLVAKCSYKSSLPGDYPEYALIAGPMK